MRMRTHRWAVFFFGVLLVFSCLVVKCISDDDYGDAIQYRFVQEDGESILEYKDSKHGYLRLGVPTFMSRFTVDRIEAEIDFLMSEGGAQRWSERFTLEILYYALNYGKDYDPDLETEKFDRPPTGLEGATNWLNESVAVCEWEGITCGFAPTQRDPQNTVHRIDIKVGQRSRQDWLKTKESPANDRIPKTAVTKIILSEKNFAGTIPTEVDMLTHLSYLDLHSNFLKGSIPNHVGLLSSLRYLDLTSNRLTGTVPWRLSFVAETLEELWLGSNVLEGAVDYHLTTLSSLRILDLSNNRISGTIPPEIRAMKSLRAIFMESNQLTGTIITEVGKLLKLKYLNLSKNRLGGRIPTELEYLTFLMQLDLSSNSLVGQIPTELFSLPYLENLHLGYNTLTGTIPEGDDVLKRGNYLDGFQWSNVKKLTSLSLQNNMFKGTLPDALLLGISSSLQRFDIGSNRLTGSISYHIGHMRRLRKFAAPSNSFTGTIPTELAFLTHLRELNLTNNGFVGHTPPYLCDNSRADSFLIKSYGCDALLCPPGSFHPNGAASVVAGCRACPASRRGERLEPPASKRLGRTTCRGIVFEQGDVNADGIVSPREVLNMLYFHTGGKHWGDRFQSWQDLDVNECDLPGITCVGREIAKIDLPDAALCTNGTNREGSPEQCHGLPAQLGLLTALEVLSLPRRRYLRGTIPTEFGQLTKLRFLDLSNCHRLSGTIPSELGLTKSLHVLNLAGCRLKSTIPSEIFQLTLLEQLNLSMNTLTGTIPSELGNLIHMRELILSRMSLNGTIPTSVSTLVSLENLEIYGNLISGTIPTEIGYARSLKRIDAFNNKLQGTIPSSLASMEALQIIHLKRNMLTGTIPYDLGSLEHLIWVDASSNIISGTIPSSFGSSMVLKDLRLGGNRIHDPIPSSLCDNTKINGGRTRQWGCDAILCPLGYFGESGFATSATGCTPCAESTTTMYLGAMSCSALGLEDFLAMFYDVMQGENWESEEGNHWKDDDIDLCYWEGIECEADGTVIEISFPVSESDL